MRAKELKGSRYSVMWEEPAAAVFTAWTWPRWMHVTSAVSRSVAVGSWHSEMADSNRPCSAQNYVRSIHGSWCSPDNWEDDRTSTPGARPGGLLSASLVATARPPGRAAASTSTLKEDLSRVTTGHDVGDCRNEPRVTAGRSTRLPGTQLQQQQSVQLANWYARLLFTLWIQTESCRKLNTESNPKKTVLLFLCTSCCSVFRSFFYICLCYTVRFWNEQEAQLMLTTGSTRLAVSRGQQTWYYSTCYI